MNHKILIPFLLLWCGCTFSQTSSDRIIYFDSLHNITDKTNYKYKRVIKDFLTNKEILETTDYFKSGSIKMNGVYVNKYNLKPIGMFVTYYENGNKESLTNLPAFGSNTKASLGKFFQWYENGNKKSETEVSYDKRTEPSFKVLKYWDKNGTIKIIDGNGDFEEKDSEEWCKGQYANGYKEGTWVGENFQYNFTYTENYKKGKLISGKSTDSNQIDHIYLSEQKNASPKKGFANFNKMLYKRIKNYIGNYNDKFVIDRYFRFTINTNGEISSIIVIKGTLDTIKDDFNECLINFLKNYGVWEPCEIRGNIVTQEYSDFIFLKNTSNSE